MNKKKKAFKTVGEVCQILGLIDNTTGRNKTYLLRFWEKKFKQAKCSVVYNGRRYYSDDNIKVLHTIKSLLNDEGLTLNKVKMLLNEKKTKTEVDSKNDKYINHEQLKKIKKIISEIKDIL